MDHRKSAQSLRSVLVIGGCGFLGHHVVEQIISLKLPQTTVSVMDIFINRNRVPSVSYYQGDLTSPDDARRICEKTTPQVMIHTASPVVASRNVGIYHDVNVLAPKFCLI